MDMQSAPQTAGAAMQLPDLDVLITKWLQHERAFNQAAAATLAIYAKALHLFADWLREDNQTPGRVTCATIAAFREWLGQRCTAQTVRRRLRAVRRFYSWMVITDRRAFSPAASIKD